MLTSIVKCRISRLHVMAPMCLDHPSPTANSPGVQWKSQLLPEWLCVIRYPARIGRITQPKSNKLLDATQPAIQKWKVEILCFRHHQSSLVLSNCLTFLAHWLGIFQYAVIQFCTDHGTKNKLNIDMIHWLWKKTMDNHDKDDLYICFCYIILLVSGGIVLPYIAKSMRSKTSVLGAILPLNANGMIRHS